SKPTEAELTKSDYMLDPTKDRLGDHFSPPIVPLTFCAGQPLGHARTGRITLAISLASRTTCTNNSLSSGKYRSLKSQIVRAEEKFPAPSIRNATSSYNFLAILRDEKTPVAYPYTNTFTSIAGSKGWLRRPSPS